MLSARYLHRFVAVLAFLALGILAATPIQAEMIDGSVFYDDFGGTALNTTNWLTPTTAGDGSVGVALGNVKVYTGYDGSTSNRAYLKSYTLNFGAAASDWWMEVKFKMSGYLIDSNESGASGMKSSWLMMSGESTGFVMTGFDFRALEHAGDNPNETVFDLGWYGADNGDAARQATVLQGSLNKDQWYTLSLHRTTAGMVDIYLDGSSIGTKSLIGGVNPTLLMFGDAATSKVGGTEYVDYVTIGVPEPGTLALLACGLIGLLCYAWRKRK